MGNPEMSSALLCFDRPPVVTGANARPMPALPERRGSVDNSPT
jgi:hypothetical protein